jgi:lysophospholipase L1-like esterase
MNASAKSAAAKKKISLWKYALFLFFIFLIILAAAELGARVLVFFYNDTSMEKKRIICHDLVLHHAWVPSKTSIDNNRSIPYKLIINKQAWPEERDIPLEKPANTCRIFFLGDSNTQGVVATEYILVRIIEKMLNENYADSGIRFEVINTGTSSYSFLQYYLLSKQILKYSPDLVIINVDMTDVPNNAVYRNTIVKDESGDIIAVKPQVKSKYIMTPHGFVKYDIKSDIWGVLEKYSDLFFFINKVRSVYFEPKIQEDETSNWMAKEWAGPVNFHVSESLKILDMNIEFLKKNNVKVMYTGVPIYTQYTGADNTKPHDILEAEAKKLNVPFLNSFKVLEKTIKPTAQADYYWKSDETHFNIKGNKLWADAYFNFLTDPSNNLLPFDKLNKK